MRQLYSNNGDSLGDSYFAGINALSKQSFLYLSAKSEPGIDMLFRRTTIQRTTALMYAIIYCRACIASADKGYLTVTLNSRLVKPVAIGYI